MTTPESRVRGGPRAPRPRDRDTRGARRPAGRWGAVDARLAAAGPRPARVRRPAGRSRPGRVGVPGLPDLARDWPTGSARAGPWCCRGSRVSRSRPTGVGSTRLRSSTPVSRTATRPTFDARAYRWSLDSRVEHDALLAAAAALHDHAIDDALGEAVAGHRTRGRHGRAQARSRHRRLPRRDRPGPAAGRPGSAGRHRRRARGDGGGQPRRASGRGRPGRGRRRGGAAGGGTRPRRGRVRLGARRRGGGGRPSSGDHDRGADLVLRPRAAEPVRHPRREVLRQRPARGHAAAALRRRHRVPSRRGRDGAGAVPGRVRELLRRRGVRGSDGAGRP